jgi:hypothetical protein
MPKFSYRKRKFLNPISSHTSSYVYAWVQSSENGFLKAAEGVIALADCHRQIMLEFSLLNKRERRQSLAKANLLIKLMSEFREALSAEIDLLERAQKGRKSLAKRN